MAALLLALFVEADGMVAVRGSSWAVVATVVGWLDEEEECESWAIATGMDETCAVARCCAWSVSSWNGWWALFVCKVFLDQQKARLLVWLWFGHVGRLSC